MKKILIISSVAIGLSACAHTPEPLCDREAIEWDKWGTTSIPMECQTVEPVVMVPESDGEPRTPPSGDPQDPTHPDEPKEPPVGDPKEPEPRDKPKKDKVKSDNSDANGKGGNKHDRKDKDRAPQEIAEGKKQ